MILAALALAACGRQPQVERIDLDDVGGTASFGLTPSPETGDAAWSIEPGGKGIDFGKMGSAPYLSLVCKLDGAGPPQLTVIREAQSEPGAKALFAILGNGVIARLKLDAVLSDSGWRWEGTYPAGAPQFDVFTGPRDVQATLPGAGMLKIAGSALPREFIEWCRRGGKEVPAEALEKAAEAVAPVNPGTPG